MEGGIMDTNAQRKGFGFDQFFKRISHSSDGTPQAKKTTKSSDEGHDVAAQVGSVQLVKMSAEKSIGKIDEADGQGTDHRGTLSRMEKRRDSEEVKRTDEEPTDDLEKLPRMETPRDLNENRRMDQEPKDYPRKLSKRKKRRDSERSRKEDEELKDYSKKSARMEKPRDSDEIKKTDEEAKDNLRQLSRIDAPQEELQDYPKELPKRKKRRDSEEIEGTDKEPKDDFRKSSRMETPRDSKESNRTDEEPQDYSRKLPKRKKRRDSEEIKEADEEPKDDFRKSSSTETPRESKESKRTDEEPKDDVRKSSRMETPRESKEGKRTDEKPQDYSRKSSRMEEPGGSEEIKEPIEEPVGNRRKSTRLEKLRDSEASKRMDEEPEDYSGKSSKMEKPRDSEVSKGVGEEPQDYSGKSSRMEKPKDSEISKKTDEERNGYSRKSSRMQKPRDSEIDKRTYEEQKDHSRKSSLLEKPRDSEVSKRTDEEQDYSRKSSRIEKPRDSALSKTTNEEAKRYSRKQSRMETPRVSEGTKKSDKEPKDSEASKEYVTKDEVGQKNLTEIINNSIKEAVMNIVKVGVCPLADSSEPRGKDPSKPFPPRALGKAHKEKENKPAIRSNISTALQPSATKTLDSHTRPSHSESSPFASPRTPRRTSNHEKSASVPRNREPYPRVIKERTAKSTRQREKTSREVSAKVSRQTKNSGHFRTDNRRMTGNVNIYICSEANENAKNSRQDHEDDDPSVENSETSSSPKPSDGNLSISTSQLLAALKKKKLNNLDDELLGCLCETPIDAERDRPVDDIDNRDDDLSCLCDDDAETEFPDSGSFSSRDVCICEDAKFSEADDAGSAIERESGRRNSRRYSSYDYNYSRPYATADRPNYENNWTSRKAKDQPKFARKDFGERCSCCDHKRCRVDRTFAMPRRKTWTALPEKRYSESSDATHKFPCIVEEEDESCCTDDKTYPQNFTVCSKRPADAVPPITADRGKHIEKSPSQSRSEPLKFEKNELPNSEAKTDRALSIVPTSDAPDPVNERDAIDMTDNAMPKELGSTARTSIQTASKRNSEAPEEEVPMPTDEVTNQETDKPTETPSQSETMTPPVIPGTKRKSSFLRRSIDRVMTIVRGSRIEDTMEDKPDRKSIQPSLIPQPDPQVSDEPATGVEQDEHLPVQFSVPPTTVPFVVSRENTAEQRSKSRISTAIASRKNLAAVSKYTLLSKVSPPLEGERKKGSLSLETQEDQGQERKKVSSSLETEEDQRNDERKKMSSLETQEDQHEYEKLRERLDDLLTKPALVENDSCKCTVPKNHNTPSNCSVCSKKVETQVSSPTAENVAGNCNCCIGRSVSMHEDASYFAGCKRAMTECECHSTEENKLEEEFCDDSGQKSPDPNNPQSESHRKAASLQEPICCQRCLDHKDAGPKSMICVYCDNPREMCICQAPISKCSQCCESLDACHCKQTLCCDWSGHRTVYPEDNGEQAMCVNAWNPRRSVRRYFARAAAENDDDHEKCWRNSKPYGSDELPYQKRAAFSNVMNELQQRIDGSVCCKVCGKVPCRCRCLDDEATRAADTWTRLSTITEEKLRGMQKRSRSKSPHDSCKCGPALRRKSAAQPVPMRICDRCKTSPCRCRRSSASPPTTPQAKCYYCKSWPCVCLPMMATANTRPLRNGDSFNRRRKERSGATEKPIDSRIDNENNKRLVPCLRRQRIRKYCYRDNPNGSSRFDRGERVR